MAVAYVPIAMGDRERVLSSRHPASIETSRPRADYHKHLYMRQRIILAYPSSEGAPLSTTVAPRIRRGYRTGDACRCPSDLATYLRVPAGLTSRRHASLIDL